MWPVYSQPVPSPDKHRGNHTQCVAKKNKSLLLCKVCLCIQRVYRKTLPEWVVSVTVRLLCPVSVYPTDKKKKKKKIRVGCGNPSLSLNGCNSA